MITGQGTEKVLLMKIEILGLVATSIIADQIGRHKVLLSINHKNYNFQEKNSQVIKERENLH